MDWTIDRLQELRAEHASGESQLAEIERHHAAVRDQLLRIEGAIQVLEEQLSAAAELVADPVS
jgi:hypothetical protein